MWALVADIIAKVVAALLGARQTAVDKATSDQAIAQGSVSAAAAETEDIIAETADERAKIQAAPADAHELAASLRARKSATASPGGTGGKA